MSLLIKNARLVNDKIVNIFIKNDLIYNISRKVRLADKTFDAKGKTVMPGVIDAHVHFRVPGMEHKENWQTGSKAAVAGGVTTVLDMPNNKPVITSRKILEQKRHLISGKSYVNYGLYIGATESNLEELKAAQNIAGIKIYLGSTTGDLLVRDYGVVERILAECDQLAAFHSEDESCLRQQNQKSKIKNQKYGMTAAEFHNQMRPEECAVASTKKIISLVKKTKKSAYICHVSSSRELEIIKQAKDQNLPVYIEATPHHLFLNTTLAQDLENFAKVNPPLRSKQSQQNLLKKLGSLVDTIATDHAPHTQSEKQQDYNQAPSGCPGIEHSLSLMLDYHHQGKISLKKIVKLMCKMPAQIFNIKKRGEIKPGYFADLTIVDINLTKEIENSKLYTKSGWSLFAGQKLTGCPVLTIANGQIVFQDGKVIGKPLGREVFKKLNAMNYEKNSNR